MSYTGDELAGVVDLFGELTRAELCEALAELAFRQGEAYEPSRFEADVDDAVRSYHLVAVDPDTAEAVDGELEDGSVLLAGPLAFPTLPEDARDLPHILDVETREVPRDAVGEAVAERFREDARAAIDAGDRSRAETLLDASYELEPWTGVDLASVREELAEATQTS